jgi:hypothetical protein
MSDNPNKRGHPDRDLISLTEEHELRDWSAKYKISRQQLIDAVHAVGHSKRAVEAELQRRGLWAP